MYISREQMWFWNPYLIFKWWIACNSKEFGCKRKLQRIHRGQLHQSWTRCSRERRWADNLVKWKVTNYFSLRPSTSPSERWAELWGWKKFKEIIKCLRQNSITHGGRESRLGFRATKIDDSSAIRTNDLLFLPSWCVRVEFRKALSARPGRGPKQI